MSVTYRGNKIDQNTHFPLKVVFFFHLAEFQAYNTDVLI